MNKLGNFLTDKGYTVNKDSVSANYSMARAEIPDGNDEVFQSIIEAGKAAGLKLDEDKSFFDEASSQIFLYGEGGKATPPEPPVVEEIVVEVAEETEKESKTPDLPSLL